MVRNGLKMVLKWFWVGFKFLVHGVVSEGRVNPPYDTNKAKKKLKKSTLYGPSYTTGLKPNTIWTCEPSLFHTRVCIKLHK